METYEELKEMNDALEIHVAKQSAEIERLREHCDRMASLAIDNARDTERLREALQKIADGERYQDDGSQYYVGYWGDFARAALQQKESEQ